MYIPKLRNVVVYLFVAIAFMEVVCITFRDTCRIAAGAINTRYSSKTYVLVCRFLPEIINIPYVE